MQYFSRSCACCMQQMDVRNSPWSEGLPDVPCYFSASGSSRKTKLPGGLGRRPADDSLDYPIQSKMQQLPWWPTLIVFILQQRGRFPILSAQRCPAQPSHGWERETSAARSPAAKTHCEQGAWHFPPSENSGSLEFHSLVLWKPGQ